MNKDYFEVLQQIECEVVLSGELFFFFSKT